MNAAQRLKRNVQALLDQHRRGVPKHRKTISGLARALDQKPNGISTILTATDVPHFKMRDLDRIAQYFGVPPAMLIKEDSSNLWELTPTEMQALRHWRSFPREIQDGMLGLLNFFAGVSPAEKSLRRFLSKYRRLSQTDQAYVERTLDSLLRHTDVPDTTTPPAP